MKKKLFTTCDGFSKCTKNCFDNNFESLSINIIVMTVWKCQLLTDYDPGSFVSKFVYGEKNIYSIRWIQQMYKKLFW